MQAKRIPLLIVIALGCTTASQSARATDTPVSVVSQLYHDYAWEVVLQDDASRRTLFDEPREVLTKYFDDSLTFLIERDRNCRERTTGVCNVDGVPMWDSNDPQAMNLTVAAIDSTNVAVSFRRQLPPPNGEEVKLTYRMTMTPRGWRVRDIIRHDGGSLVESLTRDR